MGFADEIRPPHPDERWPMAPARNWLSVEALVLVLTTLAFVSGAHVFRGAPVQFEPLDKPVVRGVVERIIAIESNGDPDAKNKRSSATGAGQLLDDTWLEAVRRHRRDLIQGRSNQEILKLRRDTELTREIVARLIEQYAAILSKRGLPVTPGTLYLSYFAGPAGAVALLSSAEDADAASRMALADVTGRTTREKLVSANPFLKVLTVADLKMWADHRMRGYSHPGGDRTEAEPPAAHDGPRRLRR
jgi:hypothetical protein